MKAVINSYRLSAISHQPYVRHFSNEKLSRYLSDKNYDYNTDYVPYQSLWDRIKEWFFNHLHFRTPNHSIYWNNFLTDIIIGIIIAGAIVLIVYFISKAERRNLFESLTKNAINYGETEENIHQMNFDELINDSISKEKYRSAVRYLYLKTLKELSDRNLIKWKPEKTNRDYNIELRSSSFGALFSEITLLFDYSWYGDAPVNEGSFSQIKNSFEQFQLQLTGNNQFN